MLIYQIKNAQNQDIISLLGKNNWENNIHFLIILVFLMPLNWYLESLKWKTLMNPFIKLSSIEALKSILVGLSFGMVTPARLGEYGGRVLMSPLGKSTEVITSTFAASISQNLINIIVGLSLSYYFIKPLTSEILIQPFLFGNIIFIQVVIMITIYFYLGPISVKMSQWSYLSRWKDLLINVSKIYPRDMLSLSIVLFWSFLRYGVYLAQYLLLLHYLDLYKEFWILTSHVAGIYLIQTLIPLPAFLSVPARGEIAILVWQNVGISPIWALTATYSLWLINLIIPAIIGVVILLISNKNKKNDQIFN